MHSVGMEEREGSREVDTLALSLPDSVAAPTVALTPPVPVPNKGVGVPEPTPPELVVKDGEGEPDGVKGAVCVIETLAQGVGVPPAAAGFSPPPLLPLDEGENKGEKVPPTSNAALTVAGTPV